MNFPRHNYQEEMLQVSICKISFNVKELVLPPSSCNSQLILALYMLFKFATYSLIYPIVDGSLQSVSCEPLGGLKNPTISP